MGLINDSLAFAKAGLAPISGLLDLIHACRNETECKLQPEARTKTRVTNFREDLVWLSISQVFTEIVSAWWENPSAVALLNDFRRVCSEPDIFHIKLNDFSVLGFIHASR